VDALSSYNNSVFSGYVASASGTTLDIKSGFFPISLGAGKTFSATSGVVNLSGSVTYAGNDLASVLGFFQGNGTSNFSVGAQSFFNGSTSGSFSTVFAPQADAQVVITYDYTPTTTAPVSSVPEAETYA